MSEVQSPSGKLISVRGAGDDDHPEPTRGAQRSRPGGLGRAQRGRQGIAVDRDCRILVLRGAGTRSAPATTSRSSTTGSRMTSLAGPPVPGDRQHIEIWCRSPSPRSTASAPAAASSSRWRATSSSPPTVRGGACPRSTGTSLPVGVAPQAHQVRRPAQSQGVEPDRRAVHRSDRPSATTCEPAVRAGRSSTAKSRP